MDGGPLSWLVHTPFFVSESSLKISALVHSLAAAAAAWTADHSLEDAAAILGSIPECLETFVILCAPSENGWPANSAGLVQSVVEEGKGEEDELGPHRLRSATIFHNDCFFLAESCALLLEQSAPGVAGLTGAQKNNGECDGEDGEKDAEGANVSASGSLLTADGAAQPVGEKGLGLGSVRSAAGAAAGGAEATTATGSVWTASAGACAATEALLTMLPRLRAAAGRSLSRIVGAVQVGLLGACSPYARCAPHFFFLFLFLPLPLSSSSSFFLFPSSSCHFTLYLSLRPSLSRSFTHSLSHSFIHSFSLSPSLHCNPSPSLFADPTGRLG